MKRVEELKLARLRKAKEAKARAKATEIARYEEIEATQRQIAAQLEAVAAIKQDAPIDPTEKLEELNQSILKLAESLLDGVTVKNIGEAKAEPVNIPSPSIQLPDWMQKSPQFNDISKAIEQNTLVLKALEKAQTKKGTQPEDYIPVRRVYMQGNRLVFDDSSTGSYSGGGGAASGSGSTTIIETNYATRVDDFTTTNVTYLGKAALNSSVSSAVWQIKKIDETTGTVITWADGNDNFDNVWGNSGDVAALTYS